MKQDDAVNEIRNIICNVARLEEKQVRNTTSFRNELMIDSIQAMQIINLIEEKYKIKIEEVEIFNVDNIEEIVELLEEYKQKV